jgi:hypothetical protein
LIQSKINTGLNIFIKKILMKKKSQRIVPISEKTLRNIVTRIIKESSNEKVNKTIELNERIEKQFSDAKKVLTKGKLKNKI